ncbi:MAG TPA: HDOD domain-containing protein [Opitutaceae bacterium]|nr:HDOD domain-containing protein [Opitutaceae bacterium]
MPTPLASQTIARIQQALRDREAASLPEVIKLIEELSNRAFTISVQELADLISRDTLVTAKVIQAANTFGYNPFGVAVTTVTQAIQVVGFNKIRNLALSMLLIEKALHGAQPEAVRESAALALCSGLFAQALTTIHPDQDSEQAFVFACLRHYGRLLLATFLSADFQQIHQRPVNESEADACRRVFGLTPLELTHRLFEDSRLPRTILRCLQDVPPTQLLQPCATPEERLTAITNFASALGEIVVSSRVGATGFADEAEKLRKNFGAKLELTQDAITILMKVVDQNIRSFTRTYGAKAVSTGVIQRISERSAQTEPLPTLAGTASPPVAETAPGTHTGPLPAETDRSAESAKPTPPTPPAPDGVAILTECLIQLTELTSATNIDLPATESVALAATRRALALQDCVLFQREPDARTYAARNGIGVLLDLVRGRPVISTERRDVFSICLTRREDVLIRDTSDPKIRPFLPEWLLSAGAISGFILLPLLNETGAVALMVGTRIGPRPLQPSARELQLLKAIRQHLVSARRLAGVKN